MYIFFINGVFLCYERLLAQGVCNCKQCGREQVKLKHEFVVCTAKFMKYLH